jgi:acetyl-CoA C-acetyltransferase
MDPRTPVIVGVAQNKRHPSASDDLENLSEPAEIMAECAALAIQDCGSEEILKSLTSLRALGILSWGYLNPGAIVASKLGIDLKESILTTTGGNGPQMLVNDAATKIQQGELDCALIVGAEAVYTRLLQSKANPPVHGKWIRRDQETAPPATLVGDERQGSGPAEMSKGLVVPIQIYPIFENAIRARKGLSIEEHRKMISKLWSDFSKVASNNPYAWSQSYRTPEEISTVSPDNRMVCFPYTKLLNANIQTDQGAAIIICSLETAQRAGISSDKFVFPLSGAQANDHWFISNRDTLNSSPALGLASKEALKLANLSIDDLAYLDLYSCFPSAVQIAALELGVAIDDPSRPLTVTGGLGFAGGPGNNYVTHSIASMVETLRSNPGSNGFVNAVGWYLTKHAVGIYSTNPPKEAFKYSNVQDRVDQLSSREVVEDASGPAQLESYTVIYERSGQAERLVACAILPDGRRTWVSSSDPQMMETAITQEIIGQKVTLLDKGDFELS